LTEYRKRKISEEHPRGRGKRRNKTQRNHMVDFMRIKILSIEEA
jgi:hypothetical protein